MIAVGSIRREDVIADFPFLRESYKGRRKAIKEFTHLAPDFVFWIFPDGKLFDAKDSHKKNTQKYLNNKLLYDLNEFYGLMSTSINFDGVFHPLIKGPVYKLDISCDRYEHSLNFLVKIEHMYVVTYYSVFSKSYYNKHLNPNAAKNAASG